MKTVPTAVLDNWFHNVSTEVLKRGYKAILSRRNTFNDARQSRLKLSNGRRLLVLSITETGWVEITDMNLMNDGFSRHRQQVTNETEADRLFSAAWHRLEG